MYHHYVKTVGLIVPSSDVNIEAAYHQFMPEEIAVATNRISLNRLSVQTLEELLPHTEQAAVDLCHAEPDVLISSSLTLGCFRDAMLQNCVEQRTGIPCVTSLLALVNLLNRCGKHRLAVLTPYQEELNILFKATLLKHGIDVCYTKQLVQSDGTACQSIREIQDLRWEELWRQLDAGEVKASGAEILLFGSSGLQGVDKIPQMEEILGIPVLISEQFTLLYALEYLGQYRPIPSLGWIFRQEPSPINSA
ncbi:hypothetical protein [Oscillibacter sp. 1-3]|uniref:maleate cis-trans isomerase family protein n=1 Tax=Oscillibacter sp. 1-3 TaxID=1235797 RepID=UPI0003403614|nr:hypothetical protein [Oscillibacter sp. 1-3]EOS67010.1 hypothetical protein C816_01159 [Oscillibacter sp. 1-3]